MSVNSETESGSSSVAEDTPSASSSYNVFGSNTLPNTPSTSDDSSTSTSSSKTLVSSPSKHSPMRSRYSETVHVIVGPEKQDFGAHKGLLRQRSKFFQAAFNGSFAEASKGTIELPEEDSAIFDIVLIWLYEGQSTESQHGEDVKSHVIQLIDIFIFGDKFGIRDLCNAAVDRIIDLYEKENGVTASHIDRIYMGTPPNSHLRRITVATYVQHPSTTFDLFNDSEAFLACPKFLLDLAKAYSKNRKTPTTPQRIENPCDYHEHAEGEGKCT